MLCLSWANILLFLQLLIVFIAISVVNVHVVFNGFLLFSIVTIRFSLQEVCLPSFEVLNCLLNLVVNCFDNENELPLKVIDSLSVSRFINSFNSSPQLGQVCLLVHGLKKVPCRLCTQMRFWMSLFNFGSSGEVGPL